MRTEPSVPNTPGRGLHAEGARRNPPTDGLCRRWTVATRGPPADLSALGAGIRGSCVLCCLTGSLPRAPGQWLLTPAPGSPPRGLPAAAAPRQGWVTAHQGRGVPAGNPCDCRGRLAFHWTSALGSLPECGTHLAGSCPVFGTSREASSRLTGWQNVHRPLRRVPWRLGTQEE